MADKLNLIAVVVYDSDPCRPRQFSFAPGEYVISFLEVYGELVEFEHVGMDVSDGLAWLSEKLRTAIYINIVSRLKVSSFEG